MNRLLLFLILSIASTSLVLGQQDNITYNLHGFGGSRYLLVDSYYGVIGKDYLTIMLESHNMKEAEWRITAKVTSVILKYPENHNFPVTHDFPTSMLNLIFISKEGSSNVSAINSSSHPLSLNNEVELLNFKSSDQVGSQNLKFNFNLNVQGGIYLKDFPRWTTIKFHVEYRLYTNNSMIAEMMLKDTAAHFFLNIEPDSKFSSISVTPDVLLEFNSIEGYMNGVTKTYTGGLKVSSTANYEVRVRSLKDRFESTTTTKTLPLDLVSLQLSGGNGTKPLVTITKDNQLILKGTTTNGNVVNYNMIYKAKPIEDQYLKINGQETFATQLMFELTTN